MEVYFVKPRWEYQSYTDFWALINLSGFNQIFVDELDIEKEGIYVTAPHNGEWEPHIKNQMDAKKRRRAHLVHWNLERPSGSVNNSGRNGLMSCNFISFTVYHFPKNKRGEFP